MINIKCFSKRKENTSRSTTTTGGYGNSISNTEVNGVYLWGQYHDHNGDVDGDITTNGGLTAQGTITTQGDINTTSYIRGGDLELTGNIVCDDINCDDLSAGGDIHTTDIHCANINCAGDTTTYNLEATNGNITNLVADFLTVTKQAHFFELIIDKIKSNSGQVILSAADARIDKVVAVTDGYKLYWRREDAATHKKIGNDFAPYDQIRCQTFNVHEGTNFNVANKYYWRLVTDTGAETTEIDGERVECNYIEVSDIDKDGTSIPEAGDEIVQLGNRSDTTRQNAIILSSVTSPDANVTAPSIVQYKGINSFTLNGKILNQMAANGNTFTGNFMVVNGNTVDNVLNLISGTTPTIHTDSEAAFLMVTSSNELDSLNDAQNLPTNVRLYDGSTLIDFSNWTTNSYITDGVTQIALKPLSTHSGTGLYIAEVMSDGAGGVNIDWNFVQNYDIYSNYQITIHIEWTDNGNTYRATKTVPVNVIVQTASVAGSDAEFDRLQILSGDATVGVNDTLSVAFTAQIQHVKGNVITTQTNLSNYSMDVVYNNSGGMYQATKDTSNNRFIYTDTITDFSGEPTIPTAITFMLIYRVGQQNNLVDTYTIPIKFNAGSIFEIQNDAITAAVTQSNGYTDAEIAVVNLTAQGLTTRVTNIENDYVTGSQLTQTADNISMSVYDNLKNRTGIDVEQGTITLNADNTNIIGNLNLFNSDNGITIYDDTGTARIQIQPDEIGSINNFNGDASYIVRTYYDGANQQTYSQTTTRQKIGTFTATDVMTMTNLKCFIQSTDGVEREMPTGNITVAIRLYREGSNTVLHTFNKTFTYNSTTNEHTSSDITYTIPTDGVYLFDAQFTYSSAPRYNRVYEEVFAVVNQHVQHQTYIGSDGMYCTPAHNAMMWAGSDAIIMRWSQDGIRVDNEMMKRTPYHVIASGEPEWLPFDNYTRVTTLSSSYFSFSNNRWVYNIQPLYDTGILACACPSYNNNNQATHVILPPFTFYSIGVQYVLPVGYTVKIVNTDALGHTGSWNSRQYIYVDDSDLNRSWQVQDKMMTFVHLGAGLWCAC